MTTIVDLSIENFVNVSIIGTPVQWGIPNVNTVCLFSTETPVNGTLGMYGVYKRPGEVAVDWGSGSLAYMIADNMLAQVPNPTSNGGYFVIVPLLKDVSLAASVTIQHMTFTAKVAGTSGNDITIALVAGGTQGSEAVTVNSTAISIVIESGVTTCEDIKTKIDDNANANVLVSVSIPTAYDTAVVTAPVTATNLAGGDVNTDETIPDAMTRCLNQLPFYYGILTDKDWTNGTDFTDLCTAVQAEDKMCFYGSATAADIEQNGRFDLVRQRADDHIRCLYRSTNITDAIAFAAAYCGRGLSTNFSGSNTCHTMHGKSLANIAADPGITQTVLTKCQAAGVDVYQSFGGIPKLFTSGKNQFFDYTYNCAWLKLALQITGANYITGVGTKVPQTEAGMAGLKDAYRTVIKQAVVNGFIAPGSWTSADWFGDHEDFLRNILEIGYYIWSLPVTQQLAADRADRKAPLVQIAIKTAGAIHSSDVLVNVNL
jgi:hypothetical protein